MKTFELFDHVYIKSTNAVGMIIWIPDSNDHDEYRTDMDGMQCGADLEKLTIEHLKVPGVRVAPNYPTRYATNYYRGIICDEYDMNWEAK